MSSSSQCSCQGNGGRRSREIEEINLGLQTARGVFLRRQIKCVVATTFINVDSKQVVLCSPCVFSLPRLPGVGQIRFKG